MTDWMTHKETANYVRTSVRQLYRLPLPYTVVGRGRRYSREVVDQHMHDTTFVPLKSNKGGSRKPPLKSMSLAEQIKLQRAKLRRRRH